MRKLLVLSFFSLLFLTACKDEENPTPANQVTIEGKPYTTITIGNLTWTSMNHAGPGGVAFDATNTKPEYGKYYTKKELEAIELPEGWRIPTQEDYTALAIHAGLTKIPSSLTDTENIRKLTSTVYWDHTQGTNALGFNAFPTGYAFGDWEPSDGSMAEFWVADGVTLSIQEAGADIKSLRMVFYQSDNSPDFRFTVRFVKDK